MSEETSSSSDWALVTQDGEIEDESEDDGSYSGSSIELLTSDEDTDGIRDDADERRAGPFFVLRLRSKEFLAESDSDEKEGPVDSLSEHDKKFESSNKGVSGDFLSKDGLPNKGGQVESLSLDEVSHQSADHDTGENSEPELLRQISTDTEKSEPELLRQISTDTEEKSEPEPLGQILTNKEEKSEPEILVPISSENGETTESEPQSNSSDTGDTSEPELIHTVADKSEEGTSLGKKLSNMKENGTDPNVTTDPMESISVTENKVSTEPSSVSDTDTKVTDTTLVTDCQGNSRSSVDSLPEVLLPEVKIDDQGISMATWELSSDNSKNESSDEPTDDNDRKDDNSIGTSSLGSSSFSLLNDDVDEHKIERDKDFEGDIDNFGRNEDEDNVSFNSQQSNEIDSSNGDITVTPEGEQQMNDDHGEDTIANQPDTRDVTMEQSNQVVYRRSKWRRRANFILLLLEVFWVMIIGFAFFGLGYYQGTADQIVKINEELDFSQQNTGLSKALKDTRDELDVFFTHFHEIKKLMDNFKQKSLDPEHVDWINSLSFNQKDYSNRNGRCSSLDRELQKMENYMANLLTATFANIKQDKMNIQDKHSVEIAILKRQINNLKNEKSDLEKDIVELGKKKYLARELEDENLALIKRISDMENQLMNAEDQSYVLQLQMSKLQKKTANEDDVAMLKEKLKGLENQRKYLANQVIFHKDTIEQLKIEKRSAEIQEAERWKVENVELKTKWGELSIKVQSLETELSKAYKKISDLEHELSDVKKDAALKPDIAYDFFKSQDEHLIKEKMEIKEEKERLNAENIELQNKLSGIKDEYERLLKQGRNDPSHDDTESSPSEENEESLNEEYKHGPTHTHGKSGQEWWHGNGGKHEENTKNDELHKSWSDAMNEILNKTKSSMVNVSKQIQDTLSQVKNLSQDLWKKHEPKVNHILSKTYENVKKNVNRVTAKVTKVTSKILEKSARWIRKFKKSKKNKRRGKKYYNGDSDEATYTASTSRRPYNNKKNHNNHDYNQKYNSDKNHDKYDYNQQSDYQNYNQENHDKYDYNQQSDDQNYNQDYNHHNSDYQKFSHDQPYISRSFLENELQSLNDSVEYINTLQRLNCNDMIDIMEDFHEFKKLEGLSILSDREKSWFFCQKAWFESMVYSDPSIDDSDCLEKLGQRQLAATDYQCCPCLGQYGNYVGKFCKNDGCSHQKPMVRKSIKKGKEYKYREEGPQIGDELRNNKTAEEDMLKNHGKFVYCDPFSHDLDCGDESWYLKRMKERDHLRKYRTSSKADWLFKRADDRDYERTKPDDWYFNRMGGGQAYEAYQDDKWYDENWYIRKIHDDKKNRHTDVRSEDP